MPQLLFYRGEEEVLRLPVSESPLTIGRSPTNDVTLPDQEISRLHAVLNEEKEGYRLIDQSRNGTLINGKKVRQQMLRHGDRIQIGPWQIVFANEAVWMEKETAVSAPPEQNSETFHGMVGKSALLRKVIALIEKIAPQEATVLILGESGTGKELVARALHDLSPRSRAPFVVLNCGAISPHLAETELFGHERGAFTGAVLRHEGAFEQARGGTLFLDEVGELPLELQPKLLRVLEEKQFRRVGGVGETRVDVRVIAATHRPLDQLVTERKFREDLYFRLFSLPITIPPLRERREDISLLVDFFLRSFLEAGSDRLRSFTPAALQRLKGHSWKGNIRELKNLVVRTLLLSASPEIGPEDLQFASAAREEAPDPLLAEVERRAILNALRQTDGNKSEAAKALGIAKSTLFQKIKDYQLKRD